ncbi:hypothetical protein ACFPJ1_40875 [Kribbella qitaiheensis]|uniref:hypothetical protein n=1 Tax=Kribbella qitaiheensis TaxID=1544730 RepID=UPI00361ADC4B
MSEQVAERVEQQEQKRRVRVWFGRYVIADYTAEPELAQRYAKAMARRFAGLRVTNDPVGDQPGRPLPSERLWDNPPN